MPVQFTTDLPDAQGLDLDGSTPDEITATWDSTTNNGEYRLEVRESDANENWGDSGTANVAYDAVLEHTFIDILDGEKYDVRIRSQTAHVLGNWLEADEITNLPAPDGIGIVNVGKTSLEVQWTDNADFEGSYQIYRRRVDYEYDDDGRLVGTVGQNTESYVDDTASPDREYEFFARARTDWVYADTSVATVTTDGIGLSDRAVPPRGWYAEVDHPSGTTLTPQILDDPVRRPTVNGFPRVELPVPQAETWHATAFDDAPLSVWHDGDREPIDQLEHRRLRPDRTVLEGRGGTQLDQRVIEDVDIQPTHEFVRDLLEANTDYVVNVDDPDADQEERVLQAADSDVDLQQAFQTVADDAPLEITSDGFFDPLQTCWVVEGEDVGNEDAVLNNEYADEFSDGSAGNAGSTTDDYQFSISTDYTTPADTLNIGVRGVRDSDNDGALVYDIYIDGSLAAEGVALPGTGGLGWKQIDLNHNELAPGDYTIELDAVDDFADTGDHAIDVIAAYDGRYNYTFDNTVHEAQGYLDGPQPYPDLVRQELEPITTPLSITDVTLDVESDDGNGLAELGIGVDGTDTYDTVTDALTHTLEYTELATTARARVGVGRDPDVTRDTKTPRTGFEPRGLDSLELRAVLDDTPVITDRSLKGKLIDVLREVLDYGNFVSEVRQDGDQTTVEVTQLEGRPTDVDPDIADYSVDRQTEDVLERAIVYGGAARVTRQTVDVTVGSWVDLPFPDSRLVEGKTSIYDGDTEFELGTDYELRRETEDGQPRIKALSDGSLSDGQTVSVDADVKPRGVYTAGDASDPERNVEDYDIPGLASKQMCDQVALYLVEKTGDAIVDVEVTVPHDSVEWSVIEAIDPAQLPGDGPYQVREIEANASETRLQLGQGQTLEENVQEIRDRTSRNAERV